MPHMAPMNWTTLLITFILTFLIFNSINYYIFNYKINSSINLIHKKIKTNWKW
uniref:ATP synthase complex subunit 8 n=1 Tax=Limnichidae sp. MJTNT-2012 TaxID=1131603 RepID=H6W8J6_9COLE|nr:ATP synthase F0 subunit 8 [Limnichidae sp. MJTNT-2012]